MGNKILSPIHVDFSRDNDILFISFASMQVYTDEPGFEWRRSFEQLPVNRLYVRDPAQYWYQRGLPGLAGDIPAAARYLHDLARDSGMRRIVCLGASSGGYAALLMGWFLRADEVHAFSPITHLPSRTILELLRLLPSRNWRLLERHLRFRRDRSLSRDYFDLRRVIAEGNGHTRYYVHYGVRHSPDRRSCRLLEGVPGLELMGYDFKHHQLANQLALTGELVDILRTTYARLAPQAGARKSRPASSLLEMA